jgi:hypothetical protein
LLPKQRHQSTKKLEAYSAEKVMLTELMQ